MHRSFSQVFRIGRDSHCDVEVRSPLVSRFHAGVFPEVGRWRARDLDSTNGLFLNGERIDRSELGDGDTLQLGKGGFVLGSFLYGLSQRLQVRDLERQAQEVFLMMKSIEVQLVEFRQRAEELGPGQLDEQLKRTDSLGRKALSDCDGYVRDRGLYRKLRTKEEQLFFGRPASGRHPGYEERCDPPSRARHRRDPRGLMGAFHSIEPSPPLKRPAAGGG